MVKSCFFPSTKRQLNIHCYRRHKFSKLKRTKHKYIILSNDGLTEDKTDSMQIYKDVYQTTRRSRMLTDLHCNVKYNLHSVRNDCNAEDKPGHISELDSTILKQ